MLKQCQCEHESHFCYGSTPDGKLAHKYGVWTHDNVEVKTPFGTFEVCSVCAKDCYSPKNLAQFADSSGSAK